MFTVTRKLRVNAAQVRRLTEHLGPAGSPALVSSILRHNVFEKFITAMLCMCNRSATSRLAKFTEVQHHCLSNDETEDTAERAHPLKGRRHGWRISSRRLSVRENLSYFSFKNELSILIFPGRYSDRKA